MATKKASTKPVVDAAIRAAIELEALDVGFALIGGLAVGARGEPRYTRDVDLVIATSSDEDAEQLLHALSQRHYQIEQIIEQTRTKRLSTARLRHPKDPGVYVDLLFASSGIENELVSNAESLPYSRNATMPIARIGHLIALKVLSENDRRLQDRIDLQILTTLASPEDWKLAERAVRLIKARGFHRGRALVTRLKRWRRAQ